MTKINFTGVVTPPEPPEPTEVTLCKKPPSPEEFEELKTGMKEWLRKYKGEIQ